MKKQFVPIVMPYNFGPNDVAQFPFVRALFPQTEEQSSPTSKSKSALVNGLAFEVAFCFTDDDTIGKNGRRLYEDIQEQIYTQWERAEEELIRFGDKYSEELKALSLAFECLSHPVLRLEYLLEMGKVVHCSEQGDYQHALQVAHSEWVQTMRTAEKQAAKQAQEEELRTILSRTPRRLGIQSVNAKKKSVELTWQPLQPFHAFKLYCAAVVIVISDEHTIRINPKELKKLYNARLKVYIKTIQFSSFGNFSLRWFAEINLDDGTRQETARSEPVNVKIEHPESEYAMKQREPLLQKARQKTGELKHNLLHFKSHPTGLNDRAELQQRQRILENGLSSATSIIDQLTRVVSVLDLAEANEGRTLSKLKEMRAEADVVEQGLSAALGSLDKKVNSKSFVRTFSTKLEAGEAVTWLTHVTKEEISRQGGDTNRLYQLLMDNKKNKKLIQPSILKAASARSDLFQPKQCNALLKRSGTSQDQKQGKSLKQGGRLSGSSIIPSGSIKSKVSTTSSSTSGTPSITTSELSVSPLTVASSKSDFAEISEPVAISDTPDKAVALQRFLQNNALLKKFVVG